MTELLRTSLIKSLSATGLRELPDGWNGKDVWIRAIAKVNKFDGSQNYVLAKRVNGEYRIVKDYGTICAIHSVVEYYPYEYLEEIFIPQEIKSDSKDIKINGIKNEKEKLEEEINGLEDKSVEELNQILTNIAVKKQDKILNSDGKRKRK